MSKIAAIYDPYLDTLGGGERYCLTVGEILLKNGWQVDLFWSGDKQILDQAKKRFSLDIDSLNIIPDIFCLPEKKIELIEDNLMHSLPKSKFNLYSKISQALQKIKSTQKYDLFFYLSDGSIPLLSSKKNFLHIQVPFLIKPNLFQKIKYLNIKKFIFNSKFTANFYPYLNTTKKYVLYPPVDTAKCLSHLPKKKYILSVGRFDNVLNAKKQDILIDAFKKFHSQNKSWQLFLAGGSLTKPSDNHYLIHLQNLAKDLPVKFFINPSFDEIIRLYEEATFYWHAAGFNVDQDKHPESTEHFGISVVEAMASKTIPLVVNRGGLPETVIDGQNGYIWESIQDLVAKTQFLTVSPKTVDSFSQNAIKDSQKFSKLEFETKLLSLINEK